MAKKFLICEDHESMAKSFGRTIKGAGHECYILFDSNPDVVLSRLEETLEKEKPDYVIIDGLNGLWNDAAQKTIRYKATPVICSGEDYIIEAAKEKGYAAFEKNRETMELLDYIQRA